MLKRLSVENYALIDSLELELSDSLNIITGETGAGKSILLGALGLLLGNRADAAAQKDQGRNCVVEGVFAIGDYGLVIVLGDVIVEPAEGDYYRRDKTGNFLDADGNRIYRGANSEWFRLEDNVDDDGTAFKTKVPANAPEKTPQYKGELMIQGKIFVGGDIEVRYVSVLEQTETREGHKDDNPTPSPSPSAATTIPPRASTATSTT